MIVHTFASESNVTNLNISSDFNRRDLSWTQCMEVVWVARLLVGQNHPPVRIATNPERLIKLGSSLLTSGEMVHQGQWWSHPQALLLCHLELPQALPSAG